MFDPAVTNLILCCLLADLSAFFFRLPDLPALESIYLTMSLLGPTPDTGVTCYLHSPKALSAGGIRQPDEKACRLGEEINTESCISPSGCHATGHHVGVDVRYFRPRQSRDLMDPRSKKITCANARGI